MPQGVKNKISMKEELQMSPSNITLLFLLFAVVMFVLEKIPLGLTSMIVCIGLVLTGVLDAKTAFAGVIDSNVILFVSMFIVGGALFETGMANKVGLIVSRFVKSERMLIVAIMVIVGLMSGVLSNTGTAAVLIPVVIGIAAKSGYKRSRLLMPLVFAAAMGGNLSLIGELEGLLKEAVVKATFQAPLRHNSVETFDEYNTGKNVGKGTPTVFWDIVPDSDQCEIYSYMAGGGCTLPGKAMVLMRGEGYEGVTKFVLDVMTSYGLNACPPLLVGVGLQHLLRLQHCYPRRH